MKRNASIAALLVWVVVACAVLAQDKPTSLSDARTAIEANLRTPQGRAYDEQLGKEFLQKQLDNFRQCKKEAGADLDSFWFLLKLDKDGTVTEVLLHPETKLGTCARQAVMKSKFSPPPQPGYWVGVYMKITH